jgi:hypothetical protein
MKKALLVFVALMLTVPAISHAGSATSRWDLTLGGYVKFDLVYATQAVGTDNRTASKSSKGGTDVAADSTDNLTWAGGETRLNWAVKGPEAWGAKTSAFVEGEFRGRSGYSEYGLFSLRHAYFQMIWPKTKLIIGHTWQAWGRIPSQTFLAVSEQHFNRGYTRVPQIRLTQTLTKNFAGVFAVQCPYNTLQTGNVGVSERANSLWPDVVLDLSFASKACGKIRTFPLKIGIGGFYGKDKYLVNEAASGVSYKDEKIDRYGVGIYWYVPIIPEKKGNKAGALGFTGQVFSGKGMGAYLPAYNAAAYNRAAGDATVTSGATTSITDVDLAYAQTQGGWVEGTYYLTDQLFMNALYGAQYNNLSSRYLAAQGTSTKTVRRIQNFTLNVMYDVNPAIRLGLEYDYVTTVYAHNQTATASNKGNFSSVRFGAYYFF